LVEISMLRTLFRAFSSQSNQKAASVPHAAKCIDPSLLKMVAGGGAPRGGWMQPESAMAAAPRGGWC